ncbi:class C sortase [Enterococcus faecium]|uniref:class C sortase n=1 Tax=Enterococcus faecium TaxID=1352 RepID=UPI0018CA8C44|nr:class C sortase [Enterococcus faecium]MBG8271702.1 class C sortase [Enterococcus faecium]MBJ2296721.1 class C sortase [Enterococcus faecium]MDM4734822.1 class C sortase [Enterococcus faecium]MDM4742325.1 class C sortase [Enterococcus faecium]MDM4749694.1 class C sortase [Enterococcus faecium]
MKNKILLFLTLICTLVLTIYPANQLYHQFKTKENVAEIQEKIEKKQTPSKEEVAKKVEQIKSNSGNQGLDNTQKTDKGVDNTQETDGGSFDIREAEGKVNPYTGDVFSKNQTKDFEPSTYSGAVGYVYIPKINVLELLFLGASQEHLYRGVAQMSATSLPLSGKGHQTVIAGHRGGYTSPQFLYVDQLVAGDHIYIDYLGEKAVYTVFRTDVIRNYGQNSTLTDIPDLDMLTLYTCHPYPQNYDRLLVRSLRDEKAKYITPQVTVGNTAYADAIDSESVSDKPETVTSSNDLFEDVDRANKELDGNNDLNIPEQGSVEMQDRTFAEKASSIFTGITNKHQKMLLVIWTVLGALASLKVLILLLEQL